MKPPKQPDLRDEIRELRARIAKLEAGSQLGDSAITKKQTTVRGGTVSIQNEEGVAVAEFGGVAPGRAGWLFSRDNGTGVFECVDRTSDGVTFRQGWVLYNAEEQAGYGGSAQELVAEDTVSGVNLARPYHPVTIAPAFSTRWETTINPTFTALYWGETPRINPWIRAAIGVEVPAGTVGQVRLTADDVVIGSAREINSSDSAFFIDGAWPVGHNHTFHWMRLEARRISGSGTVAVQPLSIWQVQS